MFIMYKYRCVKFYLFITGKDAQNFGGFVYFTLACPTGLEGPWKQRSS